MLWTEGTGAAGTDSVLIAVGSGTDGRGAWAAEDTCPGHTERIVLGRFSPEAVAAAEVAGWPAALPGDAAETGVAAGVAGLEP